ncbi:tubulin epsilon and delta complex protein 2 [Hemicordylus capensis]|uniref:tubulin epsilon and delta complex protein 2 n=1 Tax=Hemicordylus capensis TaxID=884348 RepID=UPI002302E730|nr:tubulin epsilon and delta complex protein 2 [Hemicordylus capensis]
MLPAESAHRLVSLLTQALEDCTEHQQQLQQNLVRCRALLGDWASQAPESPVPKDSKKDDQESEPPAKELEELELLNKALEKALRVRTKFLQAPCEAGKGTGGKSPKADEKPVTSATLNQQAPSPKNRDPKVVRGTSVSKKRMPPKKPSAYMLKAPYRTDPDVKRPQRKISAGASVRVPKWSAKKSSKEAATPKAKSLLKITPVGHEKAFAADGPRTLPGLLKSLHDSDQSPLFKNPAEGGDCTRTRPLLALVEHNPADPAAESLGAQSRMGEGTPDMRATSSTLQEMGSLLKLPHPYRKAVSRYTRLREKCRLCQTSPDAIAARERFVGKLQATFHSPPPAFSPAEVKKGLMHLHDIHSLLKQRMEAETPAALGENLTWEREYESLLMLEGVQAIVSQCLDKVEQLREAIESHLELSPADSACSEPCPSQECPSLGKQRCWDGEMAGLPPVLYYSSPQELTDMEDLKLQVAMLRQRLDIQKAMQAELLPLLEPGRVPEGSRASLYRAMYTLLCEGGGRFPVLVHDDELAR